MNFKRAMSGVFRIGVMKRLKRGTSIQIMPTLACNYACSYCARDYDGKRPSGPVSDRGAWMRWLEDFNSVVPIREVVLSGGEPTLLPYFGELCWSIVDRGWFLTVYTNLSNIIALDGLPQTPRIRVLATFHPEGTSPGAFVYTWEIADRHNRVDVDEIGKRVIHGHKRTNLKPFATDEALAKRVSRILVGPDFRMFIYCLNASIAYTELEGAAWANAERQIGDSNP